MIKEISLSGRDEMNNNIIKNIKISKYAKYVFIILFLYVFNFMYVPVDLQFIVILLIAMVLLSILLTNLNSLSMIIGGLLGGYVGYLLRPITFFGSRLPFDAIIRRDEHWGLIRELKPYAETSFNYIVIGFIIGAFIGLVTYRSLFMDRTKP